MLNRIKEQFKGRQVVIKGILALSVSVMTLGLLSGWGPDPIEAATSLNMDKVSKASVDFKRLGEEVTIADLAEELAPTVVNIRVTKLEKAGFQLVEIREARARCRTFWR